MPAFTEASPLCAWLVMSCMSIVIQRDLKTGLGGSSRNTKRKMRACAASSAKLRNNAQVSMGFVGRSFVGRDSRLKPSRVWVKGSSYEDVICSGSSPTHMGSELIAQAHGPK